MLPIANVGCKVESKERVDCHDPPRLLEALVVIIEAGCTTINFNTSEPKNNAEVKDFLSSSS